jgi:hypothetical protein
VDDELRDEIAGRLSGLGYDGDPDEAFLAWSSTENLEERVVGLARVDPVVLEELRRA